MRRLLLLVTVLFIGFGLSACDLIPSGVVDQVTDELCAEDPDNELCKIDDLTDITETVAQDMLLDAIDILKQANPELCDTVFAVSNTELLSACKEGTLLLETIETFEIISYEQVDQTYKFIGKMNNTTFVEVSMTLGNVNEEMRVTSFVMTLTEEPAPEAVTLEEFEAFFKAFIDDYFDTTVTDETLSDSYFITALDEDFKEDRGLNLTEGITITYVSAVMLEEGLFEVTIEISEGMESDTDTVKVRVNRIEMALRMDFEGEDQDCDGVEDCENQSGLTTEEFALLFNQFITDYFDTSISDEDFVMNYFYQATLADFGMSRQEDITNGLQITLQSAMMIEPNTFEVTIEAKKGEEVNMETLKIEVLAMNDSYYISFHGIDDDCDGMEECNNDEFVTGEEAIQLLMKYFDDYSNPAISNEEFAMMYFDGYADEKFVQMRDMDLFEGAVYMYLSVYFYEDGSFEVEYERKVMDDIHVHKRPGRIRKRPDLLTVEWDNMMDENFETDITIVTDTFNQFIMDYLNPEMTNETLQMNYFGHMDMMGFLENRQEDLSNNLMITVVSIEQVDEYGLFKVHLSLSVGEESFDDSLHIRVMKRIDQTTPLLIIEFDGKDDDCNYVGDMCELVTDPMMAYTYMNDFLVLFNNPDITDDELYMYLLDYFSLLDVRQESFLSNTVWMLDESVEVLMDDFFLFRFYINTADGIIHRDVAARLYTDGSNVYIREQYNPDDCTLTTNVCHLIVVDDMNIVEDIFMSYLYDFVNPDTVWEDINAWYFNNNAPEFLKNHFAQKNDLNATVEFNGIVPNSDYMGFYDISYTMVTNNGSSSHNVTIILWFYNGYPVIEFFDQTNECHMDPYSCTTNMSYYETNFDVLLPYIEDAFLLINDASFPSELISYYFFDPLMVEELFADRMNGAMYTLDSIQTSIDFMDESIFELTYTMTNQNQDPITTTILVRFMYTDFGMVIEVLENK